MRSIPKLTVGIPVRNGEAHVREALESLRAQTFTDFEALISDNASTDGTSVVCREFAETDPRFRYIRLERTVGIAENFDGLFRRSHSPYFKWMAHDDVIEPTLLEKCVDVLENDPTVVVAHAAEREIDENGRDLPLGWQPRQRSDSPDPCTRFRYLCWDHPCYPMFGVIRADVLDRTGLLGHFPSCDRVMLAELALHGRFVRIPERLFLHREHTGRAGRNVRLQHQQRHITPDQPERVTFPHFRMALEFLRAVDRSSLGFGQRQCCRVQVARWAIRSWRKLIDDVTYRMRPGGRRRGTGKRAEAILRPAPGPVRAGRRNDAYRGEVASRSGQCNASESVS